MINKQRINIGPSGTFFVVIIFFFFFYTIKNRKKILQPNTCENPNFNDDMAELENNSLKLIFISTGVNFTIAYFQNDKKVNKKKNCF